MNTNDVEAVALRAKLEEAEQLLSMLVVELRGPLALIRVGASSLAQGRTIASVTLESARGGRAMLRAVNQIGAAIDRLAARGPRHERASDHLSTGLDLTNMLADMDDLRPIAEARGVELRVGACSAPEAILLDCNGARAGRALTNFVTGVVQNSERGAIVIVTATYDGVGVELVVDEENSVLATGASLPCIGRELSEASTLKSSPALGLHIVKEITESLGGQIHVESAPLSGTTFRVRFSRARTSPHHTHDSQVQDRHSLAASAAANAHQNLRTDDARMVANKSPLS